MGAACCRRRTAPPVGSVGGNGGDDLGPPAPRAAKLDGQGYRLVASPSGAVRRGQRTGSSDLADFDEQQ